jgi:hypothetical protein
MILKVLGEPPDVLLLQDRLRVLLCCGCTEACCIQQLRPSRAGGLHKCVYVVFIVKPKPIHLVPLPGKRHVMSLEK